jgi:hypothetical protein
MEDAEASIRGQIGVPPALPSALNFPPRRAGIDRVCLARRRGMAAAPPPVARSRAERVPRRLPARASESKRTVQFVGVERHGGHGWAAQSPPQATNEPYGGRSSRLTGFLRKATVQFLASTPGLLVTVPLPVPNCSVG